MKWRKSAATFFFSSSDTASTLGISQTEENAVERKNPFLELDNAHSPLATDTTNLEKKQIKIISLVLFLAGVTDKRVGGL